MIDIPESIREAVTPPSTSVQEAVQQAQTKALAQIIVDLLNANEPLLKARVFGNGAQVIVEEKGGPNRYTFGVVPSVPGSDG